MLVFNVRAGQRTTDDAPGGVQALTRGIEAGLAAYAVVPAQGQQQQQQQQQQPAPSLLPSFTGDFSRREAGKALALHLVTHMRPLETEAPLVPDRYRCVPSQSIA